MPTTQPQHTITATHTQHSLLYKVVTVTTKIHLLNNMHCSELIINILKSYSGRRGNGLSTCWRVLYWNPAHATTHGSQSVNNVGKNIKHNLLIILILIYFTHTFTYTDTCTMCSWLNPSILSGSLQMTITPATGRPSESLWQLAE